MSRDFDGTDDRIDWANVFQPNGNVISVALWLFADVLNPANNIFYYNAGITGNSTGTVLGQVSGANGQLLFFRNADGGGMQAQTVANAITASAWRHILATDTNSLTASNVNFYVDGTLQTHSGDANGSGSQLVCDQNWSAGGRGSDNARNLNGRIAELAVWNRVLTQDEATALAKGWCPLFFPNGLRFYAPLFGNGSAEPNYLGATSTTIVGTAKLDHPDKSLIYPQRPLFIDPAEAAAAGHPAIRRLGGVRGARDIPVRVGAVNTF